MLHLCLSLLFISADGRKINFQPNTPGDQADFNSFLAKITGIVSLGTYKITFASPPSETVTCGGGLFYTLAPTSPWISSAVNTVCSTVLPVDLLDFSANALSENGKEKVQIKWKQLLKKGELLRSRKSNSNSKGFMPFNKVMAKNGSLETYDLIDGNPFLSINYYRLKW
ncbi:MAG: hypothetical protein HC817_09925 [Saprospiraceae bacterium]|nr:hypothetical protein [Saprospiraceae bacterium]